MLKRIQQSHIQKDLKKKMVFISGPRQAGKTWLAKHIGSAYKNTVYLNVKEPKIYFFDTGLVNGNDGAKLENHVAYSLLKHVYAKIDYQAQPYSLHYLRTREKHEVDFCLVNAGNIEKIIEVKTSDSEPSKGLWYFGNKYSLPAVQLVKNLRLESEYKGIRVVRLDTFLQDLLL